MEINLKATNTTITPAIREMVDEKLSSIEKFLKPEDTVHVEVEVDKLKDEGEVHRVEIRIQPRAHFAEATGSDLYEALDLVMPKIREQLTREKDKRISLRRKLGALFKRSK